MSVRTKIDPIDRDISAMLAEVDEAGQRRQLAAFARAQLAEAQETNRRALGMTPPHDTYVDGKAEAPLESVGVPGRIVFEFSLLDDVLTAIGAMLVQASPVLSGRFAASHIFTADGVVIEPGVSVPAASEYAFTNFQPYTRKIERGLSPQAPDGVYQSVAAMASRRFGNIARITFSFRAVPFGGVNEWASRTKSGKHRKRDRDEWLRRQPAIIISGLV